MLIPYHTLRLKVHLSHAVPNVSVPELYIKYIAGGAYELLKL